MVKAPTFYQGLCAFTEEAEKVFNHLLGYVIAFTSLVAFADVLGNGAVLQFSPVLFWIWVFAQGLCVEFQVFILIKRMPGYWNSNRVMFGVYAAFIACLCAMSIMVGSVFVQHDQQHGTVEQAMVSLGIPHIGFIYARAALAILLVALIAIDRAIEQHQMSVRPEQPVLPSPLQEEAIILATQLQEVASNQTALTEMVLQLTRTMKELQTQMEERVRPERLLEEDAFAPEQTQTIEGRIRAYLLEEPEASVRSVANMIGCSTSTANKWMSRIREEQGHPQLRAVK